MTFEIKTKTMGKSHFFNRKFYKIKHAKYIISLYNYFKCFFKFPSYQKKKKEKKKILKCYRENTMSLNTMSLNTMSLSFKPCSAEGHALQPRKKALLP